MLLNKEPNPYWIVVELTQKKLDFPAITANPRNISVLISIRNGTEELKVNTSHAVSKGLFGVPSFIVDGKLFFGQDRMQWFLN